VDASRIMTTTNPTKEKIVLIGTAFAGRPRSPLADQTKAVHSPGPSRTVHRSVRR
jgi:hypothetical protein